MAKQINTDEEFKLKRQARHRLIGAVALMLAIVIFLPMVFDSEPGVNVGNIELRIPDKNEVPEFRPNATTDQVAEPAASTVSAAIPAQVHEPVVAQTKPVETKVVAPVTPKVVPVQTAPKAVAPKKTAPPSGWVLQVGAYSREDAGRQMLDNLKKRGFPAYTEKVAGMLRVRVGGYPSREAAEKVKLKLEAIGLQPNLINPE
ncbi:MAG: SPOR domain-containing protein [Gammaproteobacteria bacterium]|nr:SPOR domain-containing protein [Gammaproteobacteria bacterium]MBU1625392.1 SPOR domain-containing protein [Gammaproteobacteria bacterium]MBU1981652.1 SPOR domain-containing protein [Gammaproteobacteria bacterium]